MVDTPKKRRVTRKDFDTVAEYISAELARRRGRRSDREKIWKDIDRQIRMEPVPSNLNSRGEIIEGTEWMPFVEPPFQAQTLELLNADARRLLFPTDRNYFSAHAATPADFLETFESQIPAIVMGENDASSVNQDNIDKIVEGTHLHFQDQYDFRKVWDHLNADAFKYGEYVGRAKIERPETFDNNYRGIIRRTKKIPMLQAMSIKNTYLDDNPRGTEIAPSTIFTYRQRLDDLAVASSKGSSDPTNQNGGWIKGAFKDLSGDANGFVQVAEYEGDLIIPRTGPSLFLPNVIVTVVQGVHDNKGVARTIRYRENPLPFHSYISGSYHDDDFNCPSSPLMKGRPVQKVAAESLSRLLQAAILNTEPPVQYDPDDPAFAKSGGPVISPRALWESTGEIKVHNIGEMEGLLQVYQEFIRQYQDVTGVSPPRLGAQTKSHQTAFAVDSELERGVIRTVDYVRSLMFGSMRTWLSMEWELIQDVLDDPQEIYIPEFRSFLSIDNKVLPKNVTYDVHGVAGPQEERVQQQARQTAIQLLAQIEPLALQTGAQPLNWNELRRSIMLEGFDDVDGFLVAPAAPSPGGAEGQPADTGAAEESPLAQLQALAEG